MVIGAHTALDWLVFWTIVAVTVVSVVAGVLLEWADARARRRARRRVVLNGLGVVEIPRRRRRRW